MQLIELNINDAIHQQALLSLMNDYMLDKMGIEAPLNDDLGVKLIEGLKQQTNYQGFLLEKEGEFVGLANCFTAFSTFKAMPLINIHDYVITPSFRGNGGGRYFLYAIKQWAKANGHCKVTLEVRYDNDKAQNLYKSLDFIECDPPMFFWYSNL